MSESQLIRRVLKPAVFTACLAPLALLVWRGLRSGLGANPIDAIQDETGTWALRFLMITLAVTPVRRLTRWNPIIRFRRVLGLFAFFYACLHLTNYVAVDQFFAMDYIVKDVMTRPFITVGFAALVLLVPLAATSTSGMIRRLGGRRWHWVHRLIYVSASGGVVHYLWLVKADRQRPLIYATILALLLGVRLWFKLTGTAPAFWKNARQNLQAVSKP